MKEAGRPSEETRQARERYYRAMSGVRDELRRAGVPIETGHNLTHSAKLWDRRSFAAALPILLRWLPLVDDRWGKEDIIRALADRRARPQAADALIEEFQRLPISETHPRVREIQVRLGQRGVKGAEISRLVEEHGNLPHDPWAAIKWAIGDALSEVADSSVGQDIIELALDRRHGTARQMIVVALGNLRQPQAVDTAIKLLRDDEVAGHAVIALGNLRAQEARSHVEQLLTHPKAWIRHQARKALAKIARANP